LGTLTLCDYIDFHILYSNSHINSTLVRDHEI
jgi:hypothetical protein